MKIVNRVEFLKQPSGTLFSNYREGTLGDICIKENTREPNDFLVQYINDSIQCINGDEYSSILADAEKNGASVKMDFECTSRDGLYDDDSTLYAVWEQEDVKALIARLSQLVD